MPAPTFAVLRACQQAIHCSLVGRLRPVCQKSLQLCTGRRQADEIDPDATEPCLLARGAVAGVTPWHEDRLDISGIVDPDRSPRMRLVVPLLVEGSGPA